MVFTTLSAIASVALLSAEVASVLPIALTVVAGAIAVMVRINEDKIRMAAGKQGLGPAPGNAPALGLGPGNAAALGLGPVTDTSTGSSVFIGI